MKVVPDYIEVPLIAKDANWSVEFTIAFKLLEEKTARKLLSKLSKATYERQFAILLSNIVYADKVTSAQGILTNSFETDIIRQLLLSFPYFKVILANYAVLLNSMSIIGKKNLQEANLFEAGKAQYELEHGKQDLESKIQKDTEELRENYSEFMNFEDEPVKQTELVEIKEEPIKKIELPKLIWKSNLKYLEVFNIAKFYTNEWGLMNPIVIIELAKEFGLKTSDTLNFVAYIKAGYESMKPAK